MFERRLDLDFSPSEVLSVAPDVRAAYQTCRDITRIASKTFYLASLFLSAEKRRAASSTAGDVMAQVREIKGIKILSTRSEVPEPGAMRELAELPGRAYGATANGLDRAWTAASDSWHQRS